MKLSRSLKISQVKLIEFLIIDSLGSSLTEFEEIDGITEHEFNIIHDKLIDQYTSPIDFQAPSEYENYKQIFEIFEDYGNKNSDKKGFISLEDFK